MVYINLIYKNFRKKIFFILLYNFDFFIKYIYIYIYYTFCNFFLLNINFLNIIVFNYLNLFVFSKKIYFINCLKNFELIYIDVFFFLKIFFQKKIKENYNFLLNYFFNKKIFNSFFYFYKNKIFFYKNKLIIYKKFFILNGFKYNIIFNKKNNFFIKNYVKKNIFINDIKYNNFNKSLINISIYNILFNFFVKWVK